MALSEKEIKEKVIQLSNKNKVDPYIIMAIIKVESNFNPNVVGDFGKSFGLMQVQRGTARQVGSFPKNITDSELKEQLFKPGVNINTGIKYFLWQLNRYDGKVLSAIAAYNAGTAFPKGLGFTNQGYVDRVNKAYYALTGWRLKGYMDSMAVEESILPDIEDITVSNQVINPTILALGLASLAGFYFLNQPKKVSRGI